MDLDKLVNQAKAELKDISDPGQLENWRIKYLARKSELSNFSSELKKMTQAQKKKMGVLYNASRKTIEQFYQEKSASLNKKEGAPHLTFDYTLPGRSSLSGHLHPLTLMYKRITDVFEKLGFEIVDGPEIEDEYHNFDALNILKDHPARDMFDTLWLKDDRAKDNRFLLRTHTSPVQIRYMQSHNPPFRIISPGRCFRHEATDATHEMQFYQIEGLVVSDDINLANFKFLIEQAVKEIFKKDLRVRFLPDYFPFVSPGIEVDISCIKCKGKGCKVCSNTGWLEVMGAGMVHPKVFENVGYPMNRYQGFAFGLGLERFAMLKYGVDDMRLFNASDLRFLKQF